MAKVRASLTTVSMTTVTIATVAVVRQLRHHRGRPQKLFHGLLKPFTLLPDFPIDSIILHFYSEVKRLAEGCRDTWRQMTYRTSDTEDEYDTGINECSVPLFPTANRMYGACRISGWH